VFVSTGDASPSMFLPDVQKGLEREREREREREEYSISVKLLETN
jgi:hypothetical protein